MTPNSLIVIITATYLIPRFLFLLFHKGDFNLAGVSILILAAITNSLIQKRSHLKAKSEIVSRFVGFIILANVCFYAIITLPDYRLLQAMPLLMILGYGLIISGANFFQFFWKELLLLLALAIPFEELLLHTNHLALYTAQSATFILNLFGLPATRESIFIYLPTGAVEVTPECAGAISIIRLIRLAFIFIFIAPQRFSVSSLVILGAASLGFITNVIRVVFITIVVAFYYEEGFNFWHHGGGAKTFSLMAILLLGLFFYIVESKPYFLKRISRLSSKIFTGIIQ